MSTSLPVPRCHVLGRSELPLYISYFNFGNSGGREKTQETCAFSLIFSGQSFKTRLNTLYVICALSLKARILGSDSNALYSGDSKLWYQKGSCACCDVTFRWS